VKVPADVDLKQAAFATIAAIAIQGVRQADLRLGEKAVVIGLGLLGKLIIQILLAAGVEPVGIDIDEAQVKSTAEIGASLAINRNNEGLEPMVASFTGGHGADAVIITASSSSTDPVNLAGILCRRKGKVVIVGGVPTGFNREHYYKKELDLRMSCSYGPGRYDPVYEEKGIDYPVGYVRWTENRNMQAYIELLKNNKLQVNKLISHSMPLEKAPEAYNMILKSEEPFSGIVIVYDTEKEAKQKVILAEKTAEPVQPNVGVIGAGNFARNTILPVLNKKCHFIGVSTAFGHDTRYIADKYGFGYATSNADDIFSDQTINTVFILTRHNLHAPYVIKALQKGKNVFVEKPLALTTESLEEIRETYHSTLNTQHSKPGSPRLMVGFNRRFAPFVQEIKTLFPAEQPKAVHYRISAGKLSRDHWAHDPEIGGGRILGEVCHFIDLAVFLSGGTISSISANNLKDSDHLLDTLNINIGFDNGSIATISYLSNGSSLLPKEYLEVFCLGQTVVIDDFKNMTIYDSKVSKTRLKKTDKGHKQELTLFLEAIKTGNPSPIPFEELYESTKATFAVRDAIKR
jgi:polar amino acid transport system substrate-binding protein